MLDAATSDWGKTQQQQQPGNNTIKLFSPIYLFTIETFLKFVSFSALQT